MAKFSVIDYRTSYLSAQIQIDERDWAADHLQAITGTTFPAGVDYYKARNPSMELRVYDLMWNPQGARLNPTDSPTDRIAVIENWLVANGYSIELAFLHVAGSGGLVQHRLLFTEWGSWRNVMNFGYAGVVAYHQARVQTLTQISPSGNRYDSVFYDTIHEVYMKSKVPVATLEYADRENWFNDLETLLATLGPLVPAGRVYLNIGPYKGTRNASMVDVAGGSLAEAANNPFNEGGYTIWSFIDARLTAGTVIDFGTGRSAHIKNLPWSGGFVGDAETIYSTIAERSLMAEYANYLMVMNATQTIYMQPYFNGVVPIPTPFSDAWLVAFEYDLGNPVGVRWLDSSGTDGAGQAYQVWMREFTNGLVVYRPHTFWSAQQIGNITAETITLPAGTWYQLWPDGSIAATPSTNITLNRLESAIFVKGAYVPPVGPTNLTAATAKNITLPSSTVQDTDDGVGNVKGVWYKFTAGANDRYVSLLFYSDEYRAIATVYTDSGITKIYGSGINSINNALQFPVNPGYTYWIHIQAVGLPTSGPPFWLEISALRYSQQTILAGSIFVPDDTVNFPGVAISGINGTVLDFMFPFPAGEAGDVAQNGNILVDDAGAGNLKLYDPNFNLLFTIPFSWAGIEPLIRFNRVSHFFFVADQGPPAIITKVNTVDGSIHPVSWTIAGVNMASMAASNDETILYYNDQTVAGGAIKTWDMTTDLAGPDFAAGVANHVVVDILVLEDDTVVALFYNSSGGINSMFVNTYDINGTLLNTFTFSGDQQASIDPHLAYSIDSPDTFWVWEHQVDYAQFSEIQVSDGTIITQFQTSEYEGGSYYYAETKNPLNRVGHSQSCPFFVLTGLVVTPPPTGGPGPGPGPGPPPVIPPVIPPIIDDCIDEEACPNNLFGPFETASEICPT